MSTPARRGWPGSRSPCRRRRRLAVRARPVRRSAGAVDAPAAAPFPAWAAEPAPAGGPRRSTPRRPAVGDAGRPAPSPLATVRGLGRFRRGEIIHRLLQLLPDVAAGAAPRPPPAPGAGAATSTTSSARRWPTPRSACLATRASPPSSAPALAPRSPSPAARRGLPEGFAVSGRMDRLVVEAGRVLVVDFKTNRPAPRAHRGRLPRLHPADGRSTAPCCRGLSRPHGSRRRWCGPTARRLMGRARPELMDAALQRLATGGRALHRQLIHSPDWSLQMSTVAVTDTSFDDRRAEVQPAGAGGFLGRVVRTLQADRPRARAALRRAVRAISPSPR